MRFRLLSYMAALLLLAGVLGLNLTPVTEYNVNTGAGTTLHETSIRYGWPMIVLIRTSAKVEEFPGVGTVAESEPVLHTPGLAPALANMAIGLAISIAGLLTCEFVLRKYAPRPKVE